jgi:hypothetical protein
MLKEKLEQLNDFIQKGKFEQVNIFIQKNILIISLIQLAIQVPFSCIVLYRTSSLPSTTITQTIEPNMTEIKQMIVDETQDRLNDNVLVFREMTIKNAKQYKDYTEKLVEEFRGLKNKQAENELEIKRIKRMLR